MTSRTPLTSRTATLARGLGSLTLGLAGLGLMAAPSSATPAGTAVVDAQGPLGVATADIAAPTTLTLAGSGFQSVQGGFGGIYVLFGWVAEGAWQPSAGGGFGSTYAYQPDAQAAENSGYQKFVTFPGSATQEEANGSSLLADGTWATDLVIPGPVLTVTDAAGAERELDCRVETCGIITIGAHGVVNANNETFTPVTFVDAASVAAPAAPADPTAEVAEEATEASTSAEPTEKATAEEPTAEVTTQEASASAEPSSEKSSSAAPWVIAGTTGAAAIAAASTAFVVNRRKKADLASGASATPEK